MLRADACMKPVRQCNEAGTHKPCTLQQTLQCSIRSSMGSQGPCPRIVCTTFTCKQSDLGIRPSARHGPRRAATAPKSVAAGQVGPEALHQTRHRSSKCSTHPPLGSLTPVWFKDPTLKPSGCAVPLPTDKVGLNYRSFVGSLPALHMHACVPQQRAGSAAAPLLLGACAAHSSSR